MVSISTSCPIRPYTQKHLRQRNVGDEHAMQVSLALLRGGALGVTLEANRSGLLF